MRNVEEIQVELLKGIGPVKSPDCDESGKGLDEMRVKWGFCLKIEETDLPGGAEVVFLKDLIDIKALNVKRKAKYSPRQQG